MPRSWAVGAGPDCPRRPRPWKDLPRPWGLVVSSAPSKWTRRRLDMRTGAAGAGGGLWGGEEVWVGRTGRQQAAAGSPAPTLLGKEQLLLGGCWRRVPRGLSGCQGHRAARGQGEEKEATRPQNLCWARPQKAPPPPVSTGSEAHPPNRSRGWRVWEGRAQLKAKGQLSTEGRRGGGSGGSCGLWAKPCGRCSCIEPAFTEHPLCAWHRAGPSAPFYR